MEFNHSLAGALHVHSSWSLKDAVGRIPAIVRRVYELGGRAVAITDHGNALGFEELRETVNAINEEIKAADPDAPLMKGLPWAEFYFDDPSLFVKRAHLIVGGMDNIGFRAFCKAITESNKHLDKQGFPLVDIALLRKYFGPGSEGHGHVVATSACMYGVISSVFLANSLIDEKVAKAEERIKKLFNPNSEQYRLNAAKRDELLAQKESLTAQIKETDALAKRPFLKKEKALKAMEGTAEYPALKAALDAEKAASAKAKEDGPRLRAERDAVSKELRRVNEICQREERDHDRWYELSEEIIALKQSYASADELHQQALKQAEIFRDIFGAENFYFEVQYHGIPEEKKAYPLVADLADELGAPLVATNDAHMVYGTEEEIKCRQIMRSLRFNRWEDVDPSDRELYIKDDAQLAEALSQILKPDQVERAIKGIGEILSRCEITYDGETHYPTFESERPGESAGQALRRKALEGIPSHYPGKEWTDVHAQRLEYELGIIESMGYSDYLCIVQDFLNYGRLIGKLDLTSRDFLDEPFNIERLVKLAKGQVGEGTGPGRGSGAGSIVCYLTGITNVDPIRYNLLFERFLNPERVSMPDIDSDFAPEVRGWAINYVKHKYGDDAVCCIMTEGTQQAKAAIRNCARLLGSQKYDDTRRFLDLGDEIAKAVPPVLNIKLKDCEAELRAKFKKNKDALTIIDNALLVEGLPTSIGMHAAGVIISDKHPVDDYVPLIFIPGTGQMATQCTMTQCEARGLLKMDFLGLKNLGIITEALKTIQARHGKSIDIEKVPIDDNVLSNIFAQGATDSVFQFESAGMKQMLRRFRPTSIEDLILLVAAYRPGPMQYLDDVIAVKQGRKTPEYVIPEMREVLDSTYGSPIYQEQIMQIFNKFAGFTLGEADIIRRYMSKKKISAFMAYKDKFVEGLCAHGASRSGAEEFWSQLVDFSRYAFNKSHAAAYAFVAYYTGWLKYHYPAEYLCAVLNRADHDSLGGIIGDCNAFGIKVIAPDINKAELAFTVSGRDIVFGMSNVKNVAAGAGAIIAERRAHGPYASFADYIRRAQPRSDVTDSLIKAGAFDAFAPYRAALSEKAPEYFELLKKLKTKEKQLAVAADETKRAKIDAAMADINESMSAIRIPANEDNPLEALEAEKDVLGAFVSAHPLNYYQSAKQLHCTPLNELLPTRRVSVMGIVSDTRITRRKSDGAEMAFFKLEDRSGIRECCCFAASYPACKAFIRDDAVVKIEGGVIQDDEDELPRILVKTMEPAPRRKRYLQLFVASEAAWPALLAKLETCRDDAGVEAVVFHKEIQRMLRLPFRLSQSRLREADVWFR